MSLPSHFPPHRVSNSDDIRTGNAVSADRTKLGVPLQGYEAQSLVVTSLGAPTVAATNNIALAQAVAGAADLTLAGSLATGGIATLDVPRNVRITSSSAGDTTQTATIFGTDKYGAALREAIAFNGAATIVGKKAFKIITRVAISAALAGNASVGTGSALGLPYAPVKGGFLRGRLNEDTADAGTYAVPERTASTATTNDTRGTYTPAGSLDGVNIYTVDIAVKNGPDNTDAFGIAQFNG